MRVIKGDAEAKFFLLSLSLLSTFRSWILLFRGWTRLLVILQCFVECLFSPQGVPFLLCILKTVFVFHIMQNLINTCFFDP